ncbi:hypothetical protein BDK51DRAFT_40518 [Blyttiomyces helicus]|uniref:Uncharacterized protein n=1 Tax=Blyttiomyces helicus TaxID=388810 RepID=A0A4P9WKM1_9FUNG|nr:hypothetical protein BDK51DRAFT_40518 [Blyttiomyces helicus]|eukprot:RKO92952.1 hypothetical protein BDK51DRAFT_40518 [Blyttiomyces helicus]
MTASASGSFCAQSLLRRAGRRRGVQLVSLLASVSVLKGQRSLSIEPLSKNAIARPSSAPPTDSGPQRDKSDEALPLARPPGPDVVDLVARKRHSQVRISRWPWAWSVRQSLARGGPFATREPPRQQHLAKPPLSLPFPLSLLEEKNMEAIPTPVPTLVPYDPWAGRPRPSILGGFQTFGARKRARACGESAGRVWAGICRGDAWGVGVGSARLGSRASKLSACFKAMQPRTPLRSVRKAWPRRHVHGTDFQEPTYGWVPRPVSFISIVSVFRNPLT